MFEQQYIILFAVYGFVAAFLVAGYLFLRRVTDGDFSVFRKTGRVVSAPFHIPKVAISFIPIAIGVALLILSPYYHTTYATTGYRYSLNIDSSPLQYVDNVCIPTALAGPSIGFQCRQFERFTNDPAVTSVSLVETPVQTPITILLFRQEYVASGFYLILLGLILTAYFLTRANNEFYIPSRREEYVVA
jgi:hypothetical protein